MHKLTRQITLLLSLAWMGMNPLHAAQSAPDGSPAFTVRLYNYAGAPTPVLTASADVARHIFARAGLETTWVLCGPAPDQPREPSCARRPGKGVLRVSVLNRTMALKLGADPASFGVAFPDDDRFGVMAAVFHHRAAELQRDSGLKASLVLGHILAHEIGHLLLGFRSHTSHGIMSAHWDENEMQQAEQGTLRFFTGQARRMRKQVGERQRADIEKLANR